MKIISNKLVYQNFIRINNVRFNNVRSKPDIDSCETRARLSIYQWKHCRRESGGSHARKTAFIERRAIIFLDQPSRTKN